ncbi:MAG: hypothetical protein JSW56_15095 [Deltaproteobacteria bacterium]|nr:MAG: hypothetical protein JSW56_15095 [Deltaproteobacteria bacterium]
MKHLFSIMIVIGIVGLLVAPGVAGDRRHSGRALSSADRSAQFVTIDFVHDTQYDVLLWPDPNCWDCLESIPGSEQWCQAVYNPGDPGFELTGDVKGFNVLLSDLFCVNSDFESARVEVMGLIIGKLKKGHKDIYMSGRLILDIDLTVEPAEMKGYWYFQEGFGTHYGTLYVEGTTSVESHGFYVGRGKYRGWIRENR